MAGFLRKHKANKIAKLKTRVIELENENETLESKNDLLKRELFLYKLKDGKIKQPTRRPMRKLMGKGGHHRR